MFPSLSLSLFLCLCSPEAVGVVCGVVYLVTLFLYIPFHFDSYLLDSSRRETFPHEKVLPPPPRQDKHAQTKQNRTIDNRCVLWCVVGR